MSFRSDLLPRGCWILLSLVLSESILAKARKPVLIRYPGPLSSTDSRADYDRDVIQLLLDKTVDRFGPYALVPSAYMPQGRALESLKEGILVDVVATTSNAERERDLLPIKHCIHKGLMGVRLLLIREGDEKRFASVQERLDLARFKAGLSHDWPDVQIMRDNGLKVETGPSYEGLFRMLAHQRFDYFPRSLAEIWDELLAHKDQNLSIEPRLVLVYPLPAYIFVNKQNIELKERLEAGWALALKDGSFDRLFQKKHGPGLARAQLDKRKRIDLKNTLMPDGDKAVNLPVSK